MFTKKYPRRKDGIMLNIIKEETIEDSVKVLLSDILEYDNVVNEFFLPVLKSKLDNPKQELDLSKEKDDFER